MAPNTTWPKHRRKSTDWRAYDRRPTDHGSAIREITLLRLRALLSQARGDNAAYKDLVNRYREMAESLGYEGHTDWAQR